MDRRAKYQKQQAYQTASDKKQGITGTDDPAENKSLGLR